VNSLVIDPAPALPPLEHIGELGRRRMPCEIETTAPIFRAGLVASMNSGGAAHSRPAAAHSTPSSRSAGRGRWETAVVCSHVRIPHRRRSPLIGMADRVGADPSDRGGYPIALSLHDPGELVRPIGAGARSPEYPELGNHPSPSARQPRCHRPEPALSRSCPSVASLLPVSTMPRPRKAIPAAAVSPPSPLSPRPLS